MISTATRSSGFSAPSPTSLPTRSGPPPSPELGAWLNPTASGFGSSACPPSSPNPAASATSRCSVTIPPDPMSCSLSDASPPDPRLHSQPDSSRPVLLQAPLPGRPPHLSNTDLPAQYHSPGSLRFPPSAPIFHTNWSCRLSVDGARGVRRSSPKRLAGEAVRSGAVNLPSGLCRLGVALHDGGSETCRGVVRIQGY